MTHPNIYIYIYLLDKMNTRKIDMKCRIIIVELIKEGHATASIQEIMLSRHGINVSKHGMQKIIQKYNTEGLYENRKRSGQSPKLSKRFMRVIRRTCLQKEPCHSQKSAMTSTLEEAYI